MRIAYVSDAIYPYNKGGKEKRLHELTTRLAVMGHDVHVYCMKWWDGPEKLRVENGVTLHAISPLYPLYSGERRSIKEGILFGLAGFKLIKEDWDVIDVDHMPFFPLYSVWLVCVLKRKKMFASWHEVWGRQYWVEYMGASGNIAALIERVAVLLPNRIFAISNHTSTLLDEKLHRKKGVSIVMCGIDYHQINAIAPANVKSDIIYAGRLLKHKNVDLLLHAVHSIKQQHASISCTIIGNGPEQDNLKQIAKELSLEDSVTFINFVPKHDDLYAYIKASKVFAFPSEREGFGIVVLEANAANVPVVAIDAEANASKTLILPDVTGSVAQKNPEDFAKHIEYWLRADKKDIAQHVKQYDWQDIAEEMEKALQLT